MIIHDVQQGTTEWLTLRSGIPTASMFSKIITPKTGKASESQYGYQNALLAERLMGRPLTEHVSFWMERGSNMEAEAVAFYEFQRDVTTVPIGFVTNDAKTIGASPDRFIENDDDGALEIKCPSPAQHVQYLLWKENSVDRAYYPQIQGQLWICEKKWVDILSYHPEMAPALVRVYRDEEYIAKLSAAVNAFSVALEMAAAELIERDIYHPIQPERQKTASEIMKEVLLESLHQ